MERTGWFSSSDDLVDRLHENVVWGMRGNFLSLPTACPQRDERLGWTGDIQVFSPTATFLFDCHAFLGSWLKDLALEQEPRDGVVPMIVPDPLGAILTPTAAWGDAATVVPRVLYERFGDVALLHEQYASMRGWVEALLDVSGDTLLWEGQFQFGDWLDPDAPPDRPGDAKTDGDIVASAHLVRSLGIVAAAAGVLANSEDAERYGDLSERARATFLRTYVSPDGRVVSDAPTAYAMALQYGIARDGAQRRAMGERLAHLVRSGGYHISTGFVGTPIILDALTATGHLAAAERLLTQTECPSWLYPVTMGATTIWERWDSMLDDGTINPGEMTSFNHYALGAVADWLHRVVAGLAPDGPGYREIQVAPRPLASLDHARASLTTPYGPAEAGWRRGADGAVTVDALVPANTTARVRLPGSAEVITVGSGRHSWTVAGEPESPPGRPSADSDLARIVDDREAYRAVISAVEALAPEHARNVRSRTRWLPTRTLADSLFPIPPAVSKEIAGVLDLLQKQRDAVR